MINFQFPGNEIGFLLDKIIPFIKRRKLQSILLYIVFIFYFSLPSFQIPLLQYSHFRITSLMEQRAFEHNLLYYPGQSWVNIDNVNPNLLKAIISMEDGNFFHHKGIDWKAIKTSIKTNKRRGIIVRGGSTITMQLAKNLFLNTGRNFYRKAKELLIAFRMEKEISKKAILQNYINAVEWGDGIFGIKKASEIYFHKEPAGLSLNECIRLASVIPSPLIHKPNVNSNYVLRRSSIIRGRIADVVLFPKN
ncbi:MAG: monofunctional biosynthetic peptidoglycan transglycosylase [Ignavibacteriaceae bacterium]